MARTFLRQETQIRNSDTYDDTVSPTEAAFETNPANIETDLNNIRSQLKTTMGTTNWWDTVTRDVETLDGDLETIETKTFLFRTQILTDITVTAAQNYEVLSVASSETPSQTAAVGAVTTEGAVVAAHGGSFGTSHSLTEVTGPSALRPDNLCEIRDTTLSEPIISSNGKQIYALLQSEIATDGHTFNDIDQRVQLSFVEENAAGTDLIATAAGDIAGKTINYMYARRYQLQNLTEDAFLSGVFLDRAANSDVTLDNAIDNQSGAATQGQNIDIQMAAATEWAWQDAASADLLRIIEGSSGGTTKVQIHSDVDLYDNDAADNDFANGIAVDSSGTEITIGETTGQIDSAAGLTLKSGGSGDVTLDATTGDLILIDENYAGGSYDTPFNLSDSSTEWDDFETNFGEVSLLAALNLAYTSANFTKTFANVTSTTVADTDVGGSGGGANLDAQIHDISGGTFVNDHDVYLNGDLLRGGADAAANNDYYPGTSLALGQLKFEFTVKTGDVLCVISHA